MVKRKSLHLIAILGILIFCLIMFSGCSKKESNPGKSYTFDVSTGDKIEILLDTSTGYDMTPDGGSFIVSKDGSTVTKGIFLEPGAYDTYSEEASRYKTFKRNRVRGHSGVYYETEEEPKEYIYMIRLNDSNTAIALSTITSEDEATNVASILTFTVNPEKSK